MRSRLLFLALVCVLLYGWYQMRIVPYGPQADRLSPTSSMERQKLLNAPDSSLHAISQTLPGVW
jgi:hypothetical protein